jgi:hypothetical protein
MANDLSGGLKVTVTDFLHAAPVFQQAGNELGRLAQSSAAILGQLGDFWGDDRAGSAFAGMYLKAQDAIFWRLGIAAGAVGGTGDGLA